MQVFIENYLCISNWKPDIFINSAIRSRLSMRWALILIGCFPQKKNTPCSLRRKRIQGLSVSIHNYWRKRQNRTFNYEFNPYSSRFSTCNNKNEPPQWISGCNWKPAAKQWQYSLKKLAHWCRKRKSWNLFRYRKKQYHLKITARGILPFVWSVQNSIWFFLFQELIMLLF